jgi:hypothetical protein
MIDCRVNTGKTVEPSTGNHTRSMSALHETVRADTMEAVHFATLRALEPEIQKCPLAGLESA